MQVFQLALAEYFSSSQTKKSDRFPLNHITSKCVIYYLGHSQSLITFQTLDWNQLWELNQSQSGKQVQRGSDCESPMWPNQGAQTRTCRECVQWLCVHLICYCVWSCTGFNKGLCCKPVSCLGHFCAREFQEFPNLCSLSNFIQYRSVQCDAGDRSC